MDSPHTLPAKPGVYVRRDVLASSAERLLGWARGVGITTVVPAEQLHVTVCYSKAHFEAPADHSVVRVAPLGKGKLSYLGNKGALVLHLESDELQKRHAALLAAGATSDYPAYLPHVTLSYFARIDPDAIDMTELPDYLMLGPEVFETIDGGGDHPVPPHTFQDDQTASASATIALAQTVPGVQIMRVGTWNGVPFARKHLEQMVDAFGSAGFSPPVKLGHDNDPKAPAYGWVRNLRLEGDVLVCDFTDVPDALVDEIKARRYDQVSAEVWKDMPRGGKTYPMMLKAVAVLGAHPPGVSDLKPLSSALDAFGSDAAVMLCTQYQENVMTEKNGAGGADSKPATEENHGDTELRAQLLAMQQRLATMEDAALKIQSLTETVQLQQAELARTRQEKTDAEIAGIVARLRFPSIRPHVEALMRFAAQARDTSGQPTVVTFTAIGDDTPRETTAVGVVRDMIDRLNKGTEHLFVEQSHGAFGDREEEAPDATADPSGKVLALAQTYAAKHGVDISRATAAVLGDPANRRLAQLYTMN